MQALEIIGTLVGLVYLYFEYRASIWLWAASIVMPAIYIFVYREAGFYADMAINVYYLLASGYGWALWMRRGHRNRRSGAVSTEASAAHPTPETAEKACGTNGTAQQQAAAAGTTVTASARTTTPDTAATNIAAADTGPTATDSTYTVATDTTAVAMRAIDTTCPTATDPAATGMRPITRMPAARWLPLLMLTTVLFAAIAFVLIRFTDSTVPYGDSFTTALSIAGLWMLAQKYVEQWLVWIAVDAVCAGLYFYKGLYPTALLYALYTVIAVFGYFKWLRMMKNTHAYA